MSLYGPLPAQNFLRLLRRIGEGAPEREIIEEILDAALGSVGAERAFLFRLRKDGGFRVLLARNGDRDPISRPASRLSHHAVRKAVESGAAHLVRDARRDRRYRTEESAGSGRGPQSILALPLRWRGGIAGGLYLDHRFRALETSAAGLEAAENWRALLEVALQSQERERLLGASGKDKDVGCRMSDVGCDDDDGDDGEVGSRRSEVGSDGTDGGAGAEKVGDTGKAEISAAPVKAVEFHGMLGASPDMLDLFDVARKLGGSGLAVLIEGETGTGKELLARAIHASSPRASAPFVAVTCGGIPDALLESELFGHARGAFTGAERDHQGLLRQADQGTVLLDEVADMSPQMQQKLLRFLADGLVRPLGGRAAARADVRILSSTQRSLQALVGRGKFRQDLFYRLRGAELTIPPLRDRKEEILLLAERFLRASSSTSGREAPAITAGVERRLLAHPWPGNVRELENEMRRLAQLGGDRVQERSLSPSIRGARTGLEAASGAADSMGRGELRLEQILAESEEKAIRAALARAGGNKSRAAKILGITRKALYRRMARFGSPRS